VAEEAIEVEDKATEALTRRLVYMEDLLSECKVWKFIII